MPEQRTSNPLRILAPAALVVFGLVFLIVVATSGVDDDSAKSNGGAQTSESAGGKDSTGKAKPKRRRASYTVKPGDSLGGISEKTGVSIETLEVLNPEIDPQALDAGAKLKLR